VDSNGSAPRILAEPNLDFTGILWQHGTRVTVLKCGRHVQKRSVIAKAVLSVCTKLKVQRMSEIASRRIYYLAAVAIVAIVLISVVANSRPVTFQSPDTPPQVKTLEVTGEGTVSTPPDEALLLLAVQTQSTSANQASSDNAAIMSSVIGALANVGIAKSAIQTMAYSLAPVYQPKQDQTAPGKIVGYTAQNTIQVTLLDFGLVGKALDVAIGAGVNDVQGVMFTLSQTTYANVEQQALQLALQDGGTKAKAMASTLGVTLLGPVSVNPGYISHPIPQRLTASAAQTPIQPGTLQVTVNVQITYQIA